MDINEPDINQIVLPKWQVYEFIEQKLRIPKEQRNDINFEMPRNVSDLQKINNTKIKKNIFINEAYS